eukprot:284818131_3
MDEAVRLKTAVMAGIPGLVKTAAMELPLGTPKTIPPVVWLDLDSRIADSALVAQLAVLSQDLIKLRSSGERELKVAADGRIEVPRLSPHPLQCRGPLELYLRGNQRGALSNLDHRPLSQQTRITPGDGYVEVRVRAVGLNFRDVLNVMGLYPGDPGNFAAYILMVFVALHKSSFGKTSLRRSWSLRGYCGAHWTKQSTEDWSAGLWSCTWMSEKLCYYGVSSICYASWLFFGSSLNSRRRRYCCVLSVGHCEHQSWPESAHSRCDWRGGTRRDPDVCREVSRSFWYSRKRCKNVLSERALRYCANCQFKEPRSIQNNNGGISAREQARRRPEFVLWQFHQVFCGHASGGRTFHRNRKEGYLDRSHGGISSCEVFYRRNWNDRRPMVPANVGENELGYSGNAQAHSGFCFYDNRFSRVQYRWGRVSIPLSPACTTYRQSRHPSQQPIGPASGKVYLLPQRRAASDCGQMPRKASFLSDNWQFAQYRSARSERTFLQRFLLYQKLLLTSRHTSGSRRVPPRQSQREALSGQLCSQCPTDSTQQRRRRELRLLPQKKSQLAQILDTPHSFSDIQVQDHRPADQSSVDCL